MSTPSHTLFVAVPSRGVVATQTAMSLLQMGSKTRVYAIRSHTCSLLAMSFNKMWTMALNERKNFTHFCMLHDDVAPKANWLDTMMDELRKSDADVVSAVVPVKDERGLSSTALLNPKTMEMTRLTMRETYKLPKTFGGEEAGKPGWAVLPNTGLWVCDFTKPWVEKICFTVRDRIFLDKPSGEWVAQTYSEDWDFGVQCLRLGLKVKATTAVKLIHKGGFDYPNFVPWGSLETDDQENTWNETASGVGQRYFPPLS